MIIGSTVSVDSYPRNAMTLVTPPIVVAQLGRVKFCFWFAPSVPANEGARFSKYDECGCGAWANHR